MLNLLPEIALTFSYSYLRILVYVSEDFVKTAVLPLLRCVILLSQRRWFHNFAFIYWESLMWFVKPNKLVIFILPSNANVVCSHFNIASDLHFDVPDRISKPIVLQSEGFIAILFYNFIYTYLPQPITREIHLCHCLNNAAQMKITRKGWVSHLLILVLVILWRKYSVLVMFSRYHWKALYGFPTFITSL